MTGHAQKEHHVPMSPVTDLAFLVALFGGPEVVVFGLLLASRRQPRWVRRNAIAFTLVAGLALVTYMYLWWKSFDYTAALRTVPPALDRAATTALAICLGAGVSVVVLGVARLIASRPPSRASAA